MTDIGFYHLTTILLDKALPKLLEKVLENNMRAVVLVEDKQAEEKINRLLWTYNPHRFLPHGTAEDGHEKNQPIYITSKEENPNNADVIVLPQVKKTDFVNKFSRCLVIFDGENEVAQARNLWKEYSNGNNLTYWKQTPEGAWEKGA